MELSKDLSKWRDGRPDEWIMDRFIRSSMDLEQENAKLKAKLHNIEEGLRRLDEILKDERILRYFNEHGVGFERLDPYKCIEATTLSGLIDKILTGGE